MYFGTVAAARSRLKLRQWIYGRVSRKCRRVLQRSPWKWRSNYFKLQTVITDIRLSMFVCVCVFRQKDNRPEGWRESPPPSLLALHTCRKSRQPLGPPTNCNMPLHSVHGCTALGGVLVPVSVSLSTRRVRHVWLSLKCGGGSWVAYDRPTTCYISGPTPPYIDHILDACPCMPRWKGQAKLKRNKSDNATGGGERIWWITLIKVI